MRYLIIALFLCSVFAPVAAQVTEAPTGFDKSNGIVDDATHQADRQKFDEERRLIGRHAVYV